MPERWTRGLDAKSKEALIYQIEHSELSRRFMDIVAEWERELQVTKSDYDTPSWSHKQAHQNGMLEMISRLKQYFNQKEKNV